MRPSLPPLPLPLPSPSLDDCHSHFIQICRFKKSGYGPTDQRTNGRANQLMDKASYRDAWKYLKMLSNKLVIFETNLEIKIKNFYSHKIVILSIYYYNYFIKAIIFVPNKFYFYEIMSCWVGVDVHFQFFSVMRAQMVAKVMMETFP